MTPLARSLARYLPRALIGPALAIAYAGMLLSVVVAGGNEEEDIIYIDVTGQ